MIFFSHVIPNMLQNVLNTPSRTTVLNTLSWSKITQLIKIIKLLHNLPAPMKMPAVRQRRAVKVFMILVTSRRCYLPPLLLSMEGSQATGHQPSYIGDRLDYLSSDPLSGYSRSVARWTMSFIKIRPIGAKALFGECPVTSKRRVGLYIYFVRSPCTQSKGY